MLTFSKEEALIASQIKKLTHEAGSHHPNIFTLARELPQLKIEIDACFLSNPYATDLFLTYLTRELLDTHKIRDVLEFYPSQNQVIAAILADHLAVSKNKIFVGSGAIEIIQAILHNFTSKKIIINLPTFSPFYEFVKDEVNIVYNHLHKKDNFQLNIESYIQLVEREKPDTVVLINPNNPNGGYINLATIEYLLDRLRGVENFIIDESFIHFAYEDETYQLKRAVALTKTFENLLIIKSMSKDFGIAGIRAGYAIMAEEKRERLLKNGYLWNLSGLAEYFFKLYVQDEFLKEYYEVRIRYIQETKYFFAALATIPNLKVYPSLANFALVEILDGTSAFDLGLKMLLKYGIYVRNCADKIGLKGEFIRIASRTKSENKIIVQALKDILSNP